jgi:pyruvate dehydrogenase E2 component (dihydrolipoamide acetyltransferase)
MSKFEYTVIMPKMSMTMEEGELLSIRVNVGDSVKLSDVLFDVATDKIDMEVESPADGIVKEILGKVGSTMTVGAPVLILLTDVQVMSFDFNSPSATEVSEETEVPSAEISPTPSPTFVELEQAAIKAMPKARVAAENRGISLHNITSTGPFGTITHEDVSGFRIGSGNEARKAANRKMVALAIEKTLGIPQITLARPSAHLNSSPAQGNAHLVSAWARILRGHPHVNVSTSDELLHEIVGVGLIMESKYGLAVPVFKDPDLLSGPAMIELIQTTRTQAIEGKVPIEMLSGSTTSVFDLSHTKISSAVPMLFPTHTTALSVGAAHTSSGESEINLTVDLRYCDALEAAELLDQLIDAL